MCIAVIATFIATPTSGAAFSDSLPLTPAAPEVTDLTPRAHKVTQTECSARRAVRFYQRRANEWRAKMGARPAKDRPRQYEPGACPRYLLALTVRKAHAARKAYERWAAERRDRYRSLYEKWRCIHEHEGAWNSNTGNGYWGGLQMDWGFMHTYGPEFIRRYGLAHRWPVWAQLEAAERAFHGFAGFGGRGYSPWGTRGMCGV